MRTPVPPTPGEGTRHTKFCESCKRKKAINASTQLKSSHNGNDTSHTNRNKRRIKKNTEPHNKECSEHTHTQTQIEESQPTIELPIETIKIKPIKKVTKIPISLNPFHSSKLINISNNEVHQLSNDVYEMELEDHSFIKRNEDSVMAALGTQLRSSNTNGGISRLSMMQAKFQEKLMLEKESRLLEMAARQDAEREDIINRVTKTSANSLSSSMSSLNSSGAGQGRVRKMFEERRNNSRGYHQSPKGYDKSFPLDPVKRDGGRPPKGGRGQSVDRAPSHMDDASMNRSRSQVAFQRVNRGDNRQQQKTPKPQVKPFPHHRSTSSLMDVNSMQNGHSRGPSPAPPSSTKSSPGPRGLPLTPQRRPTPRNPPPQQQRKPAKSNFLTVNGNDGRKSRSRTPSPSPSPTPSRTGFLSRLGFGGGNKTPAPPRTGSISARSTRLPPKDTLMINNLNPLSRSAPNTPRAKTPVPAGLKRCNYCERNFAKDRIEKHEEICKKNMAKAKKRKIFDPVKMRTKGTEAEKFVARGDHLKETKKVKKKNWRKEHEDFIKTVRAAKGISGYEAPPIDTSDYVVCPHCGRKFSDKVADRHIPKCADIQSNKSFRKPDNRGPTPAAPSRRRR